jgi:hypothetical protein
MNVCGFRLSTEMLSAQGIRFPGLTLPTGVYEPSDYTVKENVELKQKRTLTCQLGFRLRQSFVLGKRLWVLMEEHAPRGYVSGHGRS